MLHRRRKRIYGKSVPSLTPNDRIRQNVYPIDRQVECDANAGFLKYSSTNDVSRVGSTLVKQVTSCLYTKTKKTKLRGL
jgi:hypothetical protein